MKNMLMLIIIVSISFAQNTIVLCEGNYGQGNAGIWEIQGTESIIEWPGNPIGDTGQSMNIDEYYQTRLCVINNGSSTIEIYQFTYSYPNNIVNHVASVSTNGSGPREMTHGYITNWNSLSITQLDLYTYELTEVYSCPGMPEDIVLHEGFLYVAYPMNADWSTSNMVEKINPETWEVVESYTVSDGPNLMLINDDKLYVSCVSYNADWSTIPATSVIDLNTDEVINNNYGVNFSYGLDMTVIDGNVYRVYNGGIVQLDENLNILPETQIGSLTGVYSMASNNGYIYFGLTDYSAPDDVVVMNTDGEIINTFSVGAIPGSFAFRGLMVNISDNIAYNFDLNPSYPNPFNPSTVISYELMTNSNVELDIFNTQGKLVESLISSTIKQNAGYYEVVWNASNYSSGNYFVKLNVDGKILTQKITFIK
jgi:hypothetical protein